MNKILSKLERQIGGLKFAVIIILIFTSFMIVGTFVESYYGTDFANRLIYKTPLFMLIQLFMFLSILFAVFLRMPFKKRLSGFYIIHAGLILTGVGSFVTYVAGIDGTLHLMPSTPNRQIVLNKDVIEVYMPDTGTRATLELPYSAFSSNLGQKYKDMEFETYYPFTEKKLVWQEGEKEYQTDSSHSSSYLIANDNIQEEFILTLNPEAFDFKASLTLGPLNVTYLPTSMAECFGMNPASKLIVWDSKNANCFTPESRNIKVMKTDSDKRFFAIREGDQVYSFLPDLSPWAMDENLKPIQQAHLRVFSQKMFEQSPHLFVFGHKAAFYEREEESWRVIDLQKNRPSDLPWMGFQLTLTRHEDKLMPSYIPEATKPIQQNGEIIHGAGKAVKMNVRGKDYWLTDERPLVLSIDGVKTQIYLTKQSYNLPFELTLDKFKMDKDPGTERAASYESFVNLFHGDKNSSHHIYMNNPLKYDGFTFYQASYSRDPETGTYSSTLSVNVDQGRFIKYFGSLLLVLGSMLHYFLNHKRWKKGKDILGLDQEEESHA